MELDKIIIGLHKGKLLLHAEIIGSNNDVISENISYFEKTKDLLLPNPNIIYHTNKTSDGFTLNIKTNNLAKNLYLRLDEVDGRFSDNYFDLLPSRSVDIEFITGEQITLDEFNKKLKVFTIKDTY